MIIARKQCMGCQKLSHDTPNRPNVHCENNKVKVKSQSKPIKEMVMTSILNKDLPCARVGAVQDTTYVMSVMDNLLA